jgi:hypothetical protein
MVPPVMFTKEPADRSGLRQGQGSAPRNSLRMDAAGRLRRIPWSNFQAIRCGIRCSIGSLISAKIEPGPAMLCRGRGNGHVCSAPCKNRTQWVLRFRGNRLLFCGVPARRNDCPHDDRTHFAADRSAISRRGGRNAPSRSVPADRSCPHPGPFCDRLRSFHDRRSLRSCRRFLR